MPQLNLLPVLLVLAILPMSIAIKCIYQPVDEEARKFDKEVQEAERHGHPMGREEMKDKALRVWRSSTKLDCAEDASQHGDSVEATHCFSIDMSSCPKVARDYKRNLGSSEGIFTKGCVTSEYFHRKMGSEEPPDQEPITVENVCAIPAKKLGCTRCYTCNEGDFCNAGAEGKSKEKGTEEKKDTDMEKSKDKLEENGAMSITGGWPTALFLLLLAIVAFFEG